MGVVILLAALIVSHCVAFKAGAWTEQSFGEKADRWWEEN